MGRYPWIAMVVSVGVDLLLLWGVAERAGVRLKWYRMVLAVLVSGLYTGVCVFRELEMPGCYFGRFLMWAASGWICYGEEMEGFRHGVFFAVLSAAICEGAMALCGYPVNGRGGALVLLGVLCILDAVERYLLRPYIPVVLMWEHQQENILALRDTGNTLRDPVSGEPVLVAGPSVAQRMLGLTAEELRTPAETVVSRKIKGLRLIPYRAVGQSNGLMLAVRIPQAKVGARKGSVLVAFTPTVLDPEGRYHALAGGVL